MSIRRALILALGCFAIGTTAMAADFYVSPKGDDAGSGSKENLFASIKAAQEAARKLAGKEAVTVHVADGVYYLPETLIFTPADSGVTYKAVNEGGAVLSGGSKLKLKWKPFKDGIFMAITPKGLEIDQVFINGANQRMARYPNYDPEKKTAAYQGYAADAVSKEKAADWADPAGGYIHAMHGNRWGGYHYEITGKNEDGELEFVGGWQNNRRGDMHKEFRMVENIFEELDAPGEWFHDAKKGILYYMPEEGTDLKTAKVEVVRLRHLVEFQGSDKEPVRQITLQGFTVRHAARTFMDCKEQMLRSDWAIYRGGAFMLTGTEHISILDCEFDQVGGNAIFVNNYNRNTLVKGCHIHNTGASGVCFVGDPDSVRDPLFEYNEKNDFDVMDRTVGPKTANYPSEGTVEDCLIHGIGRVERQPAGVQIEMAMKITIRDTSVYDTARAGINIGDGAWGGHLIERVDVFDTVLETHDHGSFNSWGRDRFWHRDRSYSQRYVDKEPSLPFLDAMHTTVIRDSRWRCDHGWDIDLDDGSSNYDIYNNLMLNGGLKFREGFRRRAWNNIMVNNSFHPHVWYANSDDEFFGNIVMRSASGARTPKAGAAGKRVDGNLFFTDNSEDKEKYAEFEWDLNSINGDPLFVDPANGDFRVKEGSPAFKIGFENFPMDQFGVKKPSLKAIAETPIIPMLNTDGSKRLGARVSILADRYWLGARLHAIKGEEFSAYGTRKEDGGVALVSVPNHSLAAKAGLQEGDLVQALNGTPTPTVELFVQAVSQAGSGALKVKVVRQQKTASVKVQSVVYVELETSDSADGFSVLPLSSSPAGKVISNQRTHNEPLEILTDGTLGRGFGPVFSNGIRDGAYRMDLGLNKKV